MFSGGEGLIFLGENLDKHCMLLFNSVNILACKGFVV